MNQRNGARREVHLIEVVVQVVIGLLILAVVFQIGSRTVADMRARGMVPGLGFLFNAAGFRIGEGGAFDASRATNLDAMRLGTLNTLRVALISVVLATLLGFFVAIGRLSANPLASRLASGFVELFRNTPLLVQLLFWYQGVVLALPPVASSLRVGSGIAGDQTALVFLSQRGLALPRLDVTSGLAWCLILLAGLVSAFLASRYRPGPPRVWLQHRPVSLIVGVLVAYTAWWILGQPTAALSLPSLAGRFNYQGGTVLTPEFTALGLGLTIYGASFIAEVIRGGILAVPHGQREAARALGLGELDVLRRVVMPQAVRVIIPPLTNQYLNVVKNSTLGIYVGYPELFNTSLSVGNKTGQFVVITAVVMLAYLTMSLATSALMNFYNHRIRWMHR